MIATAAIALAGATLAVPTFLYLRGPAGPERFQFRVSVVGLSSENIAISPDGRNMALVLRPNTQGASSLFVRPVGSVSSRRLAGTDDALQPFWSSDSRYIGFVAGGKLKKVDASGGAPARDRPRWNGRHAARDALGTSGRRSAVTVGSWRHSGRHIQRSHRRPLLDGGAAGVFQVTTLAVGARLGPYEITGHVGAGGMGEVYKAIDTRLDRSVAVKVLPDHWADNPDMKLRFEREAQTIASLNHPNICVLHDIGRQDPAPDSGQSAIDYLVLEYLDGETLGQRIERGALGVDEALKVGIAIADALDKAHRQGVVHRDLKPSNVMLTASGRKLLDFGLAKWTPAHARSATLSHLPTVSDLTTPVAVLGTLQYMAPEQLEGIEADARTDIFAFGALLHEMVTGRKAFEGKSQVLLMAAIATTHPQPLSQTQPDTPAALDHVVRTCLAKDPNDRWQTARDLLAELEWIAQGGGRNAIPAVVPAAR